MITEDDLKEAIAECEGQRNPSSNTCVKLAAFYTIKDKLYPEKQEDSGVRPVYTYSRSAGPIETEFKNAVEGLTESELIDLMDELMSTVKVVAPKLYAGVMRKLTNN